MLVADLIYSDDDGGYYAEIFNTAEGKTIDTLPKDGVLPTHRSCVRAIRARYGSIEILEDSAT